MGRKARISVVAIVVFAVVGALFIYWWDTTYKQTIADGVSIGGIDVSGLEPEAARSQVRSNLIAPINKKIVVRHDGNSYKLNPEKLKIRADVRGMVDRALAVSQDGGILGRTWRRVSGGSIAEAIPSRIAYSKDSVGEFVSSIAGDLDREASNATVNPSGTSLVPVKASSGLRVEQEKLTKAVEKALDDPSDRRIDAPVEKVEPEVTTADLADKYPTYIVVDRAGFRLELFKNLELAKTYTVALGASGYDTPAGLYSIESKQVNPTWYVPDAEWAGNLAGTTVPPGPDNPLKARWMGIYNGAGIHGTSDVGSLGSAASHGCVRMDIPDVIDLYNRVGVGTPIYISPV